MGSPAGWTSGALAPPAPARIGSAALPTSLGPLEPRAAPDQPQQHHFSRSAWFGGCSRARAARHCACARSAPLGAPQPLGVGGSRVHVRIYGYCAHTAAAPPSSTRPQRGRAAAGAASPAAIARCPSGRRSAVAGGFCGDAEGNGGGPAAQPMTSTRHSHTAPGSAPTPKHLQCIARDLLTR